MTAPIAAMPMRFRNVKILKGMVYGDVRMGFAEDGSEVWVSVKVSGFSHPEALAPLENLLATTARNHVRFALDGRKE